ncbi:hypothetical protein AEQ67_24870 [Pseudomonas sp. RIT-PI-q]|uniref:hypothetical protein n=1 Tax=Pseudomonas sp. RIT-PI-q TaxID=1690247 RepID=UPI0006CCED22|nr:hypothetical protein [Pseudomonas sp. RIT-PI-q]KPG93705.1 hypothetical protein AEQ67_24870 [Pseudomonas sp. RIT-PI-q]
MKRNKNLKPAYETRWSAEAKLVVMDVKSFEEQEDTMALLKLLAMGHREIEEGKFQDAEDVFAELDKADRQ